MTRGKLKKILLRTAFVLVGVTVFAVGSFSLARYVSSEEAESSAGVARLGIKVFELKDGDLRANIDYTQVVPGFDIPVPCISLHLESEVSYTLYLKVTEGSDVGAVHDWSDPLFTMGNAIKGLDDKGNTHDVVSYSMAPWWSYMATDADDYVENGMTYHVKYYRYNLAADTDHGGSAAPDVKADYMFKAGEEYNYTAGEAGMIELLNGGAIIISQYYGVRDDDPPRFSLGFEAYIRQTLG